MAFVATRTREFAVARGSLQHSPMLRLPTVKLLKQPDVPLVSTERPATSCRVRRHRARHEAWGCVPRSSDRHRAVSRFVTEAVALEELFAACGVIMPVHATLKLSHASWAPDRTTCPACSPTARRRRHCLPTAAHAAVAEQTLSTSGTWLAIDEHECTVGGHSLRLLKPADVDSTIDWFIGAGREAPPFWSELWPSAIAMCTHLAKHPDLVRGKTVIEVGAGLGLVSILSVLLGARQVIMLDNEPAALQCALLSGTASGVLSAPASDVKFVDSEDTLALACTEDERQLLAAMQQRLASTAAQRHSAAAGTQNEGSAANRAAASNGTARLARTEQFHMLGPCDTHTLAQMSHQLSKQRNGSGNGAALRGSNKSEAHFSAPDAPLLQAAHFDWQAGYCGPKADVVIACDVLYEASAPAPLARVLPTLFDSDASDQRLLLADPPKRTAENRIAFMHTLAEAQPRLAVELNCILAPAETGATQDVQLVSVRRREPGETIGLPLTSVK